MRIVYAFSRRSDQGWFTVTLLSGIKQHNTYVFIHTSANRSACGALPEPCERYLRGAMNRSCQKCSLLLLIHPILRFGTVASRLLLAGWNGRFECPSKWAWFPCRVQKAAFVRLDFHCKVTLLLFHPCRALTGRPNTGFVESKTWSDVRVTYLIPWMYPKLKFAF